MRRSVSKFHQLKRMLFDDLCEFMGDRAIEDSARIPSWRSLGRRKTGLGRAGLVVRRKGARANDIVVD
jgi:hypothetical protein